MDKNKISNTYASYRVFETLKCLITKPVSIDEILQHLENIDDDDKNYSKSVIYKYISTLKFMGFGIQKTQGKYTINSLPFKLLFTQEDITAIAILNTTIDLIPETKIKNALIDFIYQLKIRHTSNFEEIIKSVNTKNILKLKSISNKEKEIMKKYEKLCNDNLSIKITYKDSDGVTVSKTCETIDVKFNDRHINFCCFDLRANHFIEITNDKIIKIEQLPNKNRGKYSSNTTVFKLKNKLAKRYTLRNDEKIIGYDENNNIIIANKKEPVNILLNRLIRYGEECEILTPKILRSNFTKLLDSILENYN